MPRGGRPNPGSRCHRRPPPRGVGSQRPSPPLGLSQAPGHGVPARAGQGKGSAWFQPRPTQRAASPAQRRSRLRAPHPRPAVGRAQPAAPRGARGGGGRTWGQAGRQGGHPKVAKSTQRTAQPGSPPPHAWGPIPWWSHAPSGAGGCGVWSWGQGGDAGSGRPYSPSRRRGRSGGASGGSSRRALPERSGRGWERKINHPRGRVSAGSEGVQLRLRRASSQPDGAARLGPSVHGHGHGHGHVLAASRALVQRCAHPAVHASCRARVRPGAHPVGRATG